MHCLFCGEHDTQVIDSRVSDDGSVVRRRRRCPACDKRYTTYERAELRLPQVVKKNGVREDFLREKLSAGFWLALRKRKVSSESVELAIDEVIQHILNRGDREVSTGVVGELVMQQLKRLDKVAWVRFASVYRDFEDIEEFQRALSEVTNSVGRGVGGA